MKELLDGLLPRLFPYLEFLCIPHEGKYDLDGSIRPKLQAWRTPGDRFVIVRDNDGADCVALKGRLRQLCRGTGHDDALVRIVCQELESWYLGEPEALASAFGDERLRGIATRRRFSDSDARPKPSGDITQLLPGYQKTGVARAMAHHMTKEGNRSTSFNTFLAGISRLTEQLDANSPAT